MRKAYYLHARKYHPDKWNEEISKISKAESEERFRSISNALEDLKMATGNFHTKGIRRKSFLPSCFYLV